MAPTDFQGFEPEPVYTYQPKKKPRGHELSPDDKAENTMIANICILVEHVIAGVKRCRIVHDVLCNTTAQFDDLVMEIACGDMRSPHHSHDLFIPDPDNVYFTFH